VTVYTASVPIFALPPLCFQDLPADLLTGSPPLFRTVPLTGP
jgi:hypothetical protein